MLLLTLNLQPKQVQVSLGFAQFDVQSPVKAGGYYEDTPRNPKKRYVVEVDGNLVQFSSKAMALAVLNRQDKPEVKPVAIVPIATVKAMAADRQALAVFQKQLENMQYKAMLQLYEDWQDDQDIEDLLMLAY